MKMNRYTALSLVCIGLSIPLSILLLNRRMAGTNVPTVRVATFNCALNREQPGELLAELRGGKSEQGRKIAEIVQRADVDVLLLCELDRDSAGEAAEVFAREYLAVAQGGQKPIEFGWVFAAPVNTGEPSGLDLDRDGKTDGPGDAYGFGKFPGQYAMALLSRHPLDLEKVRTFQRTKWSAMPDARRPKDYWTDAQWSQLRLSSKSHWDVPMHVLGTDIHLLCSHPTPPVFDGPDDHNGCRNHDEIRFWVDYITPSQSAWIVDDKGVAGGLSEVAHFVVMGDQNCDPVDGDAQRDALQVLLAHPRVQDPAPKSDGAVEMAKRQWGANSVHRGDASLDTGDFDDTPQKGPGNLRVDYVLPSRTLRVVRSGVFWPSSYQPGNGLVEASDHRLVWVDLAVPSAPK